MNWRFIDKTGDARLLASANFMHGPETVSKCILMMLRSLN